MSANVPGVDERGKPAVSHDDAFTEFDAMFVDLARRARSARFEPNSDVYLSDDRATLIVTLEIAGADLGELRIGVEERRLCITGRRYDRLRADRGSVLMKEIEYGEFSKKIHLPIAIDFQAATAEYRDGMLTIHLPVSPDAYLPKRRTEIRMTVKRILA
jgi:HSP20 family protein